MLEQLFRFMASAHRQPREQFVAEHPDCVFVVEPFARAAGGFATSAGAPSLGQETAVARIRKREGANAFGIMVTIGRARNNDVEINSPDVSKFHAYVMFGAAPGEATLTDAGSTYGTFVGARQLKAREDRVPLRPGDEVRVGSVRMTFHTPGSFYDFLKSPRALG